MRIAKFTIRSPLDKHIYGFYVWSCDNALLDACQKWIQTIILPHHPLATLLTLLNEMIIFYNFKPQDTNILKLQLLHSYG